MNLAEKVVNKMIDSDSFSKWLGIEVLEITEGYCKLRMKVRKEMTNGFFIAHGGICYSLADSALAFAANSDGTQALSIETCLQECGQHDLLLKQEIPHLQASELPLQLLQNHLGAE